MEGLIIALFKNKLQRTKEILGLFVIDRLIRTLIAEKMLKDKKGSNVLFGRRRNATKS